MADALNKILNRVQHGGFISGLGSFHNISKVLNLQFADDTLIFLEANSFMLDNLKFLLLGFEIVSSLRINFDKSEMVALNIYDAHSNSLAHQLGCKFFSLPIT